MPAHVALRERRRVAGADPDTLSGLGVVRRRRDRVGPQDRLGAVCRRRLSPAPGQRMFATDARRSADARDPRDLAAARRRSRRRRGRRRPCLTRAARRTSYSPRCWTGSPTRIPSRSSNRASSASSRNAQLRQAVLRDLAWLLNSTRLDAKMDAATFPLARRSVINFGLPALSGETATSIEISDLERGIRQAILDFEPRILPSTLRVEGHRSRRVRTSQRHRRSRSPVSCGRSRSRSICSCGPRSTSKLERSRSPNSPRRGWR